MIVALGWGGLGALRVARQGFRSKRLDVTRADVGTLGFAPQVRAAFG